MARELEPAVESLLGHPILQLGRMTRRLGFLDSKIGSLPPLFRTLRLVGTASWRPLLLTRSYLVAPSITTRNKKLLVA